MSNLAVPDPGLLTKVQALVTTYPQPPEFDLQIVCQDGEFYWSSFLLASASQLMSSLLVDGFSEKLVLLCDAGVDAVRSVLPKTLDSGILAMSEPEMEVLNRLGILQQEVERPRLVQIVSQRGMRHEPPAPSQNALNWVPVYHPPPTAIEDEEGVNIIYHREDTELPTIGPNDKKLPNIENSDLSNEEDEDDNFQEYFEIELNVSDGETEPDQANSTPNGPKEPGQLRRCKSCRVQFTAAEYGRHRLTHPTHFKSQKRLLYCRICQLDFKSQPYADYLGHIASVHKDASGKFLCPQGCQTSCKTWGHLNQHMYKHGWKRPFKCRHCDYSCTTQVNLKKHELAIHEDPERRDHTCPLCQKKFKTTSNLSEHVRTHDKSNRFSCPECGKIFRSGLGYQQHLSLHNGAMVQCMVCTDKFLSKSSALRHEKDVHSFYRNAKHGNKYICRYRDCSSAFEREEDKRLHCRKVHQEDDGSAILVCELCHDVFPSEPLLWLHRRTTHADIVAAVRRHRHRRKSDRQSLLLRGELVSSAAAGDALHARSDSANEALLMADEVTEQKSEPVKERKCECCDKLFAYEYDRLAHMVQKQGSGLFCPLSGCVRGQRAFSQLRSLTAHLRRHTGEPGRYSCSMCEQTFVRHSQAQQHAASHSFSTSKIACTYPYCDENFASILELDQHWETHDPEHNKTAFLCRLCQNSYENEEEKKAHLLSEHSSAVTVNSLTCSYCSQLQPSLLVLNMHERYCRSQDSRSGRASKERTICNQCGLALNSRSDVVKHQRGGQCIYSRKSETSVSTFMKQQQDFVCPKTEEELEIGTEFVIDVASIDHGEEEVIDRVEEEEEVEMAEEYLMEIDSDNVVIEVVQQHGAAGHSGQFVATVVKHKQRK